MNTGYKPEFTLPMVMFLPLLGGQVFLIAWGRKLSLRLRIVGSFASLTILCIVLLLVCEYIHNNLVSFIVALIVVLFIGIHLPGSL